MEAPECELARGVLLERAAKQLLRLGVLLEAIEPNRSGFFQKVGLERAFHERSKTLARLCDERPFSCLASCATQGFPRGEVIRAFVQRTAQEHDGLGASFRFDERTRVGCVQRPPTELSAVIELSQKGGRPQLGVTDVLRHSGIGLGLLPRQLRLEFVIAFQRRQIAIQQVSVQAATYLFYRQLPCSILI